MSSYSVRILARGRTSYATYGINPTHKNSCVKYKLPIYVVGIDRSIDDVGMIQAKQPREMSNTTRYKLDLGFRRATTPYVCTSDGQRAGSTFIYTYGTHHNMIV